MNLPKIFMKSILSKVLLSCMYCSSSQYISIWRKFSAHSVAHPNVKTVKNTIAMVVETKLARLWKAVGKVFAQAYATAPLNPENHNYFRIFQEAAMVNQKLF